MTRSSGPRVAQSVFKMARLLAFLIPVSIQSSYLFRQADGWLFENFSLFSALSKPTRDTRDSIYVVRQGDGIELRLARELGQVAGELVQHRGLRALLRAGIVLVAEEGERLLAHLVEPGAEGLEDLGGDRLPLLHEAEEQVLGADIVVAELARLLDGELQHALGLGRERHLAERERLREAGQRALHLRLHRLQTETEPLQHRRRDSLAVPDEPEQHVLRADEVVPEPACFLSSQDDDPSRALGEPFKHWLSPPLPWRPEAVLVFHDG